MATGAVLAWGEWENWRSSRRLVAAASGCSEAVIVLGHRDRGPAANAVNRWRVRAALRSIDRALPASRLVLSGGAAAPGRPTEASLMATYAHAVRGYDGELVLEQDSRCTWENVVNVIPLVEDVDRIKIVSDPMHALKARAYLLRQRPDLASRLARSGDYRFGEWLPLKPVLATYGRWTLRGIATRA